ncbi:hypothetical protein KY290_033656 [Solanum tuberosum]|uniref:Uncharacterized protein n=1 Tax=Solanum tuberosum TaxID=4113 RepID=A0ABQ7U2R7_SOLTU|nr:hypothetical protein KY289_033027 [Solanum tuberosum]KAH0647670.1 hypothetical protein KY285_032918 [Solanum tuberosum]KAH0740613.1 hypothetical protein KY290_033656 [Solanum tuberosum]
MKSIAENLAAIAQQLKDDDLILYILSGLCPDYDALVVSVTSRAEAISIADLHSLLLSHETRLESLNLIEQAWYPDSGATNHLTNDLNNVTIRGDYSGSANGECPIGRKTSRWPLQASLHWQI